ncbi:hypothetical protein CRG98_019955 [Punica granatum]|uniref:Uncharacterized protein n=1 Tax=Punica granatum TaxID=22663 RepID=A0A2I0JTK3_PUNGR|nr:hypothetical protein CRG98_019955 [Punica granatum]
MGDTVTLGMVMIGWVTVDTVMGGAAAVDCVANKALSDPASVVMTGGVTTGVVTVSVVVTGLGLVVAPGWFAREAVVTMAIAGSHRQCQ